MTSLDKAVLTVQLFRMTEARFEGALSGRRKERVDGIGKTAYALSDGKVLTLWYGGYAITVLVRISTPLETEKRLAAALIARL
jgi:hypothetical protein